MKKITYILILALGILHAQTYTCQTQWIQSEGKKYAPPENVKTLEITFIDKMDAITLKTQNFKTRYDYQSFIDIKGRLGISYKAANGTIVDMFKDGTLMSWRGNTPMLKAQCPTMKLDIKKH